MFCLYGKSGNGRPDLPKHFVFHQVLYAIFDFENDVDHRRRSLIIVEAHERHDRRRRRRLVINFLLIKQISSLMLLMF